MRYLIIACSLSSLLFTISCNKGENGPDRSGSEKLVRTVEKALSDSLITEFEYTITGKLEAIMMEGRNPFNAEARIMFFRDASENLVKVIEKSHFLKNNMGCDSVLTVLNYDASAQRHSHMIRTSRSLLSYRYDSTVFFYDGLNRINRKLQYVTDFPTGSTTSTTNVTMFDIAYSPGGDMDTFYVKSPDPVTGIFSAYYYYVYQHDQMANPLPLGNEGVILFQKYAVGLHNRTSFGLRNPTSPSLDNTTTISHTYNDNMHPEISVSVSSQGSAPSTTRWYYQ
jgi:hypothetical protein